MIDELRAESRHRLVQHLELGIRRALKRVIAQLRNGLTWKDAGSVLRSILQTPRVARLDVTIFNPRLDPDGALANRLAALIAGSVASIRNVL